MSLKIQMKTDGDDCYLKWEAKLDFRALRIAKHEAALLHLQNLWQEPLFNDDRRALVRNQM